MYESDYISPLVKSIVIDCASHENERFKQTIEMITNT
jgi:hypothetical protein